jgi:hypothetical protein
VLVEEEEEGKRRGRVGIGVRGISEGGKCKKGKEKKR